MLVAVSWHISTFPLFSLSLKGGLQGGDDTWYTGLVPVSSLSRQRVACWGPQNVGLAPEPMAHWLTAKPPCGGWRPCCAARDTVLSGQPWTSLTAFRKLPETDHQRKRFGSVWKISFNATIVIPPSLPIFPLLYFCFCFSFWSCSFIFSTVEQWGFLNVWSCSGGRSSGDFQDQTGHVTGFNLVLGILFEFCWWAFLYILVLTVFW